MAFIAFARLGDAKTNGDPALLAQASGRRTFSSITKPSRRVSRTAILGALIKLGELGARRLSKAEIAIYGGTVMMPACDSRAAARDIGAIFHPPEIVQPLGGQVALELRSPEDWLYNGAKAQNFCTL